MLSSLNIRLRGSDLFERHITVSPTVLRHHTSSRVFADMAKFAAVFLLAAMAFAVVQGRSVLRAGSVEVTPGKHPLSVVAKYRA